MSFSSRVKDELSKLKPKGEPERRAMLCALTHTAGSLTLGRGVGVQYITEHHGTGKLIAQLASSLYDVETSIAVRERDRLNSRATMVRLKGEGCRALLTDAGILLGSGELLELGAAPEWIFESDGGESDVAVRAFLRGAFMGAGSLSDPRKGYHLEIVCRHKRFADAVCRALAAFGVSARTTERRSSSVAYIKDGGAIASVLALLGAVDAVLEFENTRIERGLANDINRVGNFENANMEKTARAAAQQYLDIELIASEIGLSSLPVRLREAAELRLCDPEATLQELALELGISKSGLNHRLAKLAAIAEEIRLERGKPV